MSLTVSHAECMHQAKILAIVTDAELPAAMKVNGYEVHLDSLVVRLAFFASNRKPAHTYHYHTSRISSN